MMPAGLKLQSHTYIVLNDADQNTETWTKARKRIHVHGNDNAKNSLVSVLCLAKHILGLATEMFKIKSKLYRKFRYLQIHAWLGILQRNPATSRIKTLNTHGKCIIQCCLNMKLVVLDKLPEVGRWSPQLIRKTWILLKINIKLSIKGLLMSILILMSSPFIVKTAKSDFELYLSTGM